MPQVATYQNETKFLDCLALNRCQNGLFSSNNVAFELKNRVVYAEVIQVATWVKIGSTPPRKQT